MSLTLYITDLLDFDGNSLEGDYITHAFNNNNHTRHIIKHSVASLVYSFSSMELNKISLFMDILNKRWRTYTWDVAVNVADDIVNDWLQYGNQDEISLIDIFMKYINEISGIFLLLESIKIDPHSDFTYRNNRKIPKIIDVDDITWLPMQ